MGTKRRLISHMHCPAGVRRRAGGASASRSLFADAARVAGAGAAVENAASAARQHSAELPSPGQRASPRLPAEAEALATFVHSMGDRLPSAEQEEAAAAAAGADPPPPRPSALLVAGDQVDPGPACHSLPVHSCVNNQPRSEA